MIESSCPVCGEEIHMAEPDTGLGSRILCPECGALLEIVSEEPIEVGVVEPDFFVDDEDEFEEEDDDDL
ncbi:hypothetical protein ACFLSZ_04215 [Candidatus Bipolaricaulota bacterium]